VNIVLIILGGGVGAVLRYLLGDYLDKKIKFKRIPVVIILINILGAGGLGLFLGNYYQAITYSFYSCSVYLCFGVGFFGAFTTFSTFSFEAAGLLRQKRYKGFMLYLLLTVVGSLAAFYLGIIPFLQSC